MFSKKNLLHTEVDILENEIIENYPEVLGILLLDQTTKENIIWATDNYEYLGESYSKKSQMFSHLITGSNGNLIMPRVQKEKNLQDARIKDMAEVFTPSWICNAQNNLIDNAWFKKVNVFNIEVQLSDGCNSWKVNQKKIRFSQSKPWKHYVKDKRLEVSCGEAPYITSRYDTTNGKFIPVNERIGIIDRKLRVISENVEKSGEWLKAAQLAYKCTYAYEWQGDSLLLAREAMLITFIENYTLKFGKEPLLKSIQKIANIISWNVWQMDGLKGVVPYSCLNNKITSTNLFGESVIKEIVCNGCLNESMKKHNGIYCLLKDWTSKVSKTSKEVNVFRYIDLC